MSKIWGGCLGCRVFFWIANLQNQRSGCKIFKIDAYAVHEFKVYRDSYLIYTLNVLTRNLWVAASHPSLDPHPAQPALRSDGKVLGNPSRWSFQSMHQRSRWGEGTQGTQGTEIFAGFFANRASFERRNEFWSWRSEVQTPVANGWSIFSHQRSPCASLNVLLTVRYPIHGLFMKWQQCHPGSEDKVYFIDEHGILAWTWSGCGWIKSHILPSGNSCQFAVEHHHFN